MINCLRFIFISLAASVREDLQRKFGPNNLAQLPGMCCSFSTF